MTEHNVTYMCPTLEGEEIFEGFDSNAPLNIQTKMERLEFSGEYKTLATLTLPYTMTGRLEFASIHSNPPGIRTIQPAVVMKKVGNSKLLWTGSAMENQSPYLTKKVVDRLVKSLIEKPSIEVDAPACVEVVQWENEKGVLLTIFNEQEHYPFIPVSELSVTVSKGIKKAVDLSSGEELNVERHNDGTSTIYLPKLALFQFIEAAE